VNLEALVGASWSWRKKKSTRSSDQLANGVAGRVSGPLCGLWGEWGGLGLAGKDLSHQ
jgi:hypothetical protein